ncbi:DELLA protein GAI1 [Linum grandiflorum]
MADQIFSFQFNHGGIQDQRPPPSLPNQRFHSDPFSLFEGWISPQQPSSDQFLFPGYELYQQPIENHPISVQQPPQGVSELDEMINNRQVVVHDKDGTIDRQALSELDELIYSQVLIKEPIRGNPRVSTSDLSSPLFDLLRAATNGASRKRLIHNNVCKPCNNERIDDSAAGLSTEELVRMAGARFIQSSAKSGDLVGRPFDVSFSEEEFRNVELVEFLLTAAEKVGDEQFERARNLLTECDLRSTPSGDSVQRLVYYFTRALRERINRETGKEALEESASFHEILTPPKECFLEFYEKVPFGQVSEFAAIQAIVDSVANATRIHIVDFNLKNGEQWTIFMQALVSREDRNPVDHLTITAIGTMGKDLLEETGKWLTGFAETMALSFSFNLIMVEDFTDLEEDMFEVDSDETVAILAEYVLTTLIASIEKLDYVMEVMRHLNPCVMVVTEVESNQNSSVFVNRFIETLFTTSAFFDCLDVCMDRDSPHRTFAESRFFGEAVRIVVATEGEERVIRSVKVETWRGYFARSRMEEADLSFSCMYQAELVAKKFPSWRFCTVGMDGKSLIVRWKGSPIHSVTAWKFNVDD